MFELPCFDENDRLLGHLIFEDDPRPAWMAVGATRMLKDVAGRPEKPKIEIDIGEGWGAFFGTWGNHIEDGAPRPHIVVTSAEKIAQSLLFRPVGHLGNVWRDKAQ